MEEFGGESKAELGEAPRPYTPQGLYLAQIYWKKPVILAARIAQVISTLIAFSLMADVFRDAFSDLTSFQYTLTINILAFVYSLGQLSFSIWNIMRPSAVPSSRLTPWYQSGTFILDQMFAYFLISCGSAASANIHLSRLCNGATSSDGSTFCPRLSGCMTFTFIAFIAFAMSTVVTGYHLVKCILKA